MFDNLSERLERSFKILKGEGKITEINVAETLKETLGTCPCTDHHRQRDACNQSFHIVWYISTLSGGVFK